MRFNVLNTEVVWIQSVKWPNLYDNHVCACVCAYVNTCMWALAVEGCLIAHFVYANKIAHSFQSMRCYFCSCCCWRWRCCYYSGWSFYVVGVVNNCRFAWIYFNRITENKRFMFNYKGVNCILDAALLWQSQEKSKRVGKRNIKDLFNANRHTNKYYSCHKQMYTPNFVFFFVVDWVIAWPFPRPSTPGYI